MTKAKKQIVMEQGIEDVEGVLERLAGIADVAAEEPYLTDAQAFLTQGVACLRKQLVSEFDIKLPEGKPPEEIKPEPAKRKPPAAKARAK
jgi:hypothetical protein